MLQVYLPPQLDSLFWYQYSTFFTEFRNEEALISTGESGEAATASDTSVISVLSMPG